ncbi:Hippurate hydrolase [Paraburkholderia domus]|jgi:amidohydrolase|uniref:M20 aminoacylase family protein n=1 Tax=Paraburkholderia domus TaxID=2793075 RepID=UPI00191353B8|nr:M20 aminoacylase family protein [Paraburkholderia domus]MBK5048395.1 amidohydrolase [Burkholderia sp. R-70006]MBK5060624.1 amidohydrolase [Burkholderia sp. R-70199]MBK5085648.1 amidohydrolase [Burkholderia sp. R-69927]MBK5181977.1 amidohydrolase [Burkholderia sp. R-69749]MCI0147953.1 amidohydrolase [Paraburkholderia sediminicola]
MLEAQVVEADLESAGLIADVVADEQTFVDLRRQIHAHPETGFDVVNTAELVAGLLKTWGYDVHTGIGGTGVVGQLKLGNGTRKIGIRADMDALPIHEQTHLPYASRIPGKMHACGHDGHTAILLAAAKHLATSRGFDGTLNLIFQPDEENLCGARRMIEEGLFERFPCDAVYALHNGPGIPVGQFVVKTGGVTAASDVATVTLTGVGGHGAMPDRARDPIVAAGSLIMALQTIVSRNLPASEVGVVSIGGIHAGATHNVIPDTVKLLLNMRSTHPEMRERIEKRVHEIVTLQAQCFGVEASIDYKRLVPVVVNAEGPTALARDVLTDLVGAANVLTDTKGMMGSEDFAWMSDVVPGCYVMIGNGVGEWGGCMVHNPKYDFNDRIISLGASYWVKLVEAYLG